MAVRLACLLLALNLSNGNEKEGQFKSMQSEVMHHNCNERGRLLKAGLYKSIRMNDRKANRLIDITL